MVIFTEETHQLIQINPESLENLRNLESPKRPKGCDIYMIRRAWRKKVDGELPTFGKLPAGHLDL